MAFIFNPNKKRGVFMIPSGATKSPTPTPDPFTNTYSLAFDGIDDRVELSSNFVASTEFTISFWMKPSTISGNGSPYVIGRFPLLFNNYIKLDQLGVIWILIDQTLVKFLEGTYGGGANNIVLNEWQNIIITRDSSNGLRCYRNGADYGYSGTPITNSSTLTLNSIGRNYSNTYGFQGSLDEISFWNSDETANVSTISTSPVVDLTSLNPVAWYRNGDNGTFKSPQWLIPNNINVANSRFSNFSFEYDGVDDKIELSSQSFNITATISVSAWVKIPTTNTGGASPFIQIIVGEDTKAGTNRNWALFWRGGSTLNGFSAFIYDSSGAYVTVNSALPTPNDNNWHHLMFTYTGDTSTDGLKLFVDGVQIAQATSSNGGLRASTSVIPTIGGVSNTIQRMFEGNIDEVSIFNSVQDASTIYNSGVPTDISSLSPVGYWRSENSTFLTNWTVTDNGSGGNDGTSANMTIEDRVGDASNSSNNAVSFNQVEADRKTDVPT